MSVSICVPFYNCETFLPDMIRSVFAQTHQDWELILIDDGSKDRSLEIARSVKDDRVRVFSDGENKRQARRRNELAKLATRDVIAVMDADDVMHPTRMETQLSCLNEQDICLVSSGICIISDKNRVLSVRNCHGRYEITPRGFLSYKHGIMHPAVTARKQWFLDNPYDPNMLHGDDFELLLRCVLDGSLSNDSVRIIDTPLLYYREDSLQTLEKIRIGDKDIAYAMKKHKNKISPATYLYYRLFWKTRTYIYGAAAVMGILPWLKRKKDRPVNNAALLHELDTSLQTVLQTPVPGMDEFLKSHERITDHQ